MQAEVSVWVEDLLDDLEGEQNRKVGSLMEKSGGFQELEAFLAEKGFPDTEAVVNEDQGAIIQRLTREWFAQSGYTPSRR